jgi:hypothetical protein
VGEGGGPLLWECGVLDREWSCDERGGRGGSISDSFHVKFGFAMSSVALSVISPGIDTNTWIIWDKLMR